MAVDPGSTAVEAADLGRAVLAALGPEHMFVRLKSHHLLLGMAVLADPDRTFDRLKSHHLLLGR